MSSQIYVSVFSCVGDKGVNRFFSKCIISLAGLNFALLEPNINGAGNTRTAVGKSNAQIDVCDERTMSYQYLILNRSGNGKTVSSIYRTLLVFSCPVVACLKADVSQETKATSKTFFREATKARGSS